MSAAPEKPVSFAAVAQAVFDANPFLPPWAPCSPIGKSRHWLGDPLLPAARRFVAARPFTGPRALMRRFGVGLQRARWLLVALEEKGVVRGHWGRLVARGELDGREVLSFRVYRVQSWAWANLQKGFV
ncbi:hypothetical protein [Pseudomonas costantinii]|uniref:FtsK gamma domain-containing protein n=1 Tax=Pseudomonas costantinii TaxID=168469 RepID=A0A1H4U4S4_9PSED|nr:hypothetical protein [Pseudomonas costantinii]SEC63719.1 hypothetical protein SAMN04515675_0062 [Pseudomonas costantinii]